MEGKRGQKHVISYLFVSPGEPAFVLISSSVLMKIFGVVPAFSPNCRLAEGSSVVVSRKAPFGERVNCLSNLVNGDRLAGLAGGGRLGVRDLSEPKSGFAGPGKAQGAHCPNSAGGCGILGSFPSFPGCACGLDFAFWCADL